ncbi:tetratricopeptide repeat-containing sensor histidine kinase [Pedobacter nyackensis]|uniref:histidine kinase n=1 Tax=Pedobacter nyackensis TaxID=475255 RepID=A0A1W2EZM6_9SPHI|nr:tetratricopeptide repeat-containing sensor histidine kinase [Pedobacter nyackensis]SMD14678.1 Signal transduction histidine kinase [Pedobacter nyackensis]
MVSRATVYYSNVFRITAIIAFLGYSLITISCKQQSTENPDHTVQADSILDNTNDLLNSGQIKKAKIYLDSSYQFFQKPGVTDLWRKYEHEVNFYLNHEFNPDSARIYADSMQWILNDKKEKYEVEYAKTIFLQGDVLVAEKRYNEAFKRYYDGRTFALKHFGSCSLYEFSYKLGMVRYNQEQYLKAIPHLKQALAENANCKESDGFNKIFVFPQSNLNTIALCYEQAQKPDSAIYYYRQALSFIDGYAGKYPDRKHFIEIARGVIFGNLGGVFVRTNNYLQAERHLKESIAINDRPTFDILDAQSAKIKLADLYIKHSNLNSAEKILNELEVYLSEQPKTNPAGEAIRSMWYELKWNYFDKSGQIPKAYYYLQKYHVIQDSLNQLKAGLKVIDMDRAFRDTEQQYKLALLNKDNQLRKGYLAGFIGISVLSIVLLGMVWYNLKRSRKLNNKMAEQNKELQMTLGSLEHSQRENTDLMKVVAHDLRNPIGGITSLSELMLQEKGRSAQDITMLELIKTSGQNSLGLVNDLLTSNTLIKDPEKESIDLYLMLRYCVDLLFFKANQKKQKLVLNALHITILVNREKMWRVLSNLIANAIKFSPEGAEISIAMKSLNDTVLIKVEDCGIGIPDHMKDKIFDMFTEAKREGTGGEKPFGLGLAISKQIVEAHNGRIWFHSKPDDGTIFYVELPI